MCLGMNKSWQASSKWGEWNDRVRIKWVMTLLATLIMQDK